MYAMLACVILPSCDQFLGIPSHNDYHLVLHTGKTLMRDVTACIVSQKTDEWIKTGWVILARIWGHSITMWTKFCPFLNTFLPLTTLRWTFFTLSVDKDRHFLNTYPPYLVHVIFNDPSDCYAENLY